MRGSEESLPALLVGEPIKGLTTGFGTNPGEDNKKVGTPCTTKFGAVNAT